MLNESNGNGTVAENEVQDFASDVKNGDNHEQNGDHHEEQEESKQNGRQGGKSGNNRDKEKLEAEYFRKVFIGSLKYSSTEDSLKSYFSKFGELVDCVVMKESKSGKSRGFGFVSYRTSAMVDEMMKHRPHKLDGRELEVKRATPREESGKPGAEATTKKLFVGGVREGLNEDHLREYFNKYGKIEDCIVMKEKETGKLRGFAFVSFDDYDPVDRIVLEKFHTINNQNLAVKKALPKDQTNSAIGNSRGGNRDGGSGGGFRNQSRNENRFNDFNDDFTNNNSFNGGGGFNNFNSNSGLAGNMPGMGNFANFAMIAQKMIQAAALGNGGAGSFGNMDQAESDNGGGFNRSNQGQNRRNGGGGGAGPMKGGKNNRRSGPY